VPRIEPDKIAGERRALEQWLDFQRSTFLTKCAGLSAEQLKQRAVPPSNLSLLGLARHLADGERGWLRQCAAREDVPDMYYRRDAPQADFDDVDGADAETDMDAYRHEVEAARVAVADMALDDVMPFPWGGPDRDLRWIYLHLIEEYARHNGHADLLRERIDGVTGA
jgi:hypothetical protein